MGWTGSKGSTGTTNHPPGIALPSRDGVVSGSWDKRTQPINPESGGLEDISPSQAQAARGGERSLCGIPDGFAPLLLKP